MFLTGSTIDQPKSKYLLKLVKWAYQRASPGRQLNRKIELMCLHS